jgi:nucleoside-diphosphate-sugar epimerase
MRVVVTGARGFLGGALARSLRREGHHVVAMSRAPAPGVDVAAPLADLSRHVRAGDVVVNAAGVPIKDAASDVAVIRDNLAIAREVARACAMNGARLVHISSADIWPLDARDGAREDDAPLPDTAYGLSKLAAERELSPQHVVVRPTYVYGAGMFEGRVFASVVKQARAGNTVILRGDPESTTDYVHVDDVARAVSLLLSSASGIFHVASGTLTPLADLARTLAHAANPRAEVRFDDVTQVPRQRGTVSTAALRALGWSPEVSLDEGCARYAREVPA